MQLFLSQKATGITRNAAVEPYDEPVADLFMGTVGKRRGTADPLHQLTYVVVSGHAVHAHVQRQQQFSKSIVSLRRIVLDQVAGDDDPVRQPVAGLIVIENALQRRVRGEAAQAAFRIGKQMRVCNVQNPYQFTRGCIRVRFDTRDPRCASNSPKQTLVAVVLCFVRTVLFDTNVLGLFISQFGELGTYATQVQARDFFVEMLGQYINRVFVLVAVVP